MICINCKNEQLNVLTYCQICGKSFIDSGFLDSIIDRKMKTNIKSFVEAHGQKIYNDFYKIGQTCVTVLRLKFKKSQYEIIQKDITEEIAREVLNNSTMLRKYQPFEKPYSETSGEDDNIGNGLSIDTKLLLFNNACYSLAQNPRVIIENQKEFEFIWCYSVDKDVNLDRSKLNHL